MKNLMIALGLAFVLGLGFSCSTMSGSSTGTSTTNNGLTAAAWRLVKFDGKVIDSTTFTRTPEVRFWVGSKVTGNDGCNLITGTYSVQGDKILFGNMAGTKMACVNTNYENYNRFLNRTDKFKVDNNKLYFYEGTKELMSYIKK
ncbi:META domain-containing protein [Flavobacterium pedocola]